MENEFHTLEGACVPFVPLGPGYEGVSLSNQVCPLVGSAAGQSAVDRNVFIKVIYDFAFVHLWMVSTLILVFSLIIID